MQMKVEVNLSTLSSIFAASAVGLDVSRALSVGVLIQRCSFELSEEQEGAIG